MGVVLPLYAWFYMCRRCFTTVSVVVTYGGVALRFGRGFTFVAFTFTFTFTVVVVVFTSAGVILL